jgi:hypothetical protein
MDGHGRKSRLSFQVGLHHIDQLGGVLVPPVAIERHIGHVQANVILKNLAHQAFHGASQRRDEMEKIGAVSLRFQGAFYRVDLATDAPYTGEELCLPLDCATL